MQTLIPINDLVGIKANKRYQRILLGTDKLIQADLTALSDRVRLIFPVSEMVYCELKRREIMYTVIAHVRVPFILRERSDRKIDDLFIFAFLLAVRSINPNELGLVDQPVPLIGDGYEGGCREGSFSLVFSQPVSGPQALVVVRRVLETSYEKTRTMLGRAGEIRANRLLPSL